MQSDAEGVSALNGEGSVMCVVCETAKSVERCVESVWRYCSCIACANSFFCAFSGINIHGEGVYPDWFSDLLSWTLWSCVHAKASYLFAPPLLGALLSVAVVTSLAVFWCYTNEINQSGTWGILAPYTSAICALPSLRSTHSTLTVAVFSTDI